MLDELPDLAKRLKDFVRENPQGEYPSSFDHGDLLKGFTALTAAQLVKAAMACRHNLSIPVTNDALSLAELRSYENRVNTAPLGEFPGSGVGLVRVVDFRMGKDNYSLGRLSPGRIWANLEYSPLGWPELSDMAEADLNVLFNPGSHAELLVDPKDAAILATETKHISELRRDWGFPG